MPPEGRSTESSWIPSNGLEGLLIFIFGGSPGLSSLRQSVCRDVLKTLPSSLTR